MRVALLAFALLSSSSFAVAEPLPIQPASPRLDCVANRVHHAQRDQRPQARRLDQLPAGDLHLAVVREVNGCQEPVIVRQDVGRSRR